MEFSIELREWLELRTQLMKSIQLVLNETSMLSYLLPSKANNEQAISDDKSEELSSLLSCRDGHVEHLYDIQTRMLNKMENMARILSKDTSMELSHQMAIGALRLGAIMDQVQSQQILEVCMTDRLMKRVHDLNESDLTDTKSLLACFAHPPYLNMSELEALSRVMAPS